MTFPRFLRETNPVLWDRRCMPRLLFGCRAKRTCLLAAEMEAARRAGALSRVLVAYSRDPAEPPRYVQHVLVQEPALVRGAGARGLLHIFICGDANMAAGVHEALQEATADDGIVERLRREGRLHEDVFGAPLHFGAASSAPSSFASSSAAKTQPPAPATPPPAGGDRAASVPACVPLATVPSDGPDAQSDAPAGTRPSLREHALARSGLQLLRRGSSSASNSGRLLLLRRGSSGASSAAGTASSACCGSSGGASSAHAAHHGAGGAHHGAGASSGASPARLALEAQRDYLRKAEEVWAKSSTSSDGQSKSPSRAEHAPTKSGVSLSSFGRSANAEAARRAEHHAVGDELLRRRNRRIAILHTGAASPKPVPRPRRRPHAPADEAGAITPLQRVARASRALGAVLVRRASAAARLGNRPAVPATAGCATPCPPLP